MGFWKDAGDFVKDTVNDVVGGESVGSAIGKNAGDLAGDVLGDLTGGNKTGGGNPPPSSTPTTKPTGNTSKRDLSRKQKTTSVNFMDATKSNYTNIGFPSVMGWKKAKQILGMTYGAFALTVTGIVLTAVSLWGTFKKK